MNNIKLDKYIVVAYGDSEEGLEILSITFDTYEEALRFKESDYEKTKHPDSFILATLKE